MPPPNSSASGSRKGAMRKGTHSCYECRKRKVRCIFPKNASICDGCDAKGRNCTEQRRELLQAAGVDIGETLRERVARLEAIIEASNSAAANQTSKNIPGKDMRESGDISECSSPSACEPTPAASSSSDESHLVVRDSAQNIDPLVTLFDNAIVSHVLLFTSLTTDGNSGEVAAQIWPKSVLPSLMRQQIQRLCRNACTPGTYFFRISCRRSFWG